MKMYILPDGRPTEWPTSKELAKHKRTVKYNDGIPCPDCNDCSIKFTANDRCFYCARLQSQHLLNIAVGVAHVILDYGPPRVFLAAAGWRKIDHEDDIIAKHYNELAEALHSLGLEGDFTQPIDRARRLPISATECREWGADFFVRKDPCSRYGHFGIRTPENECAECMRLRSNPPVSARQAAITAGEKWYGPKDACKGCNEKAPRRVDNGQCWCRYPTGRQAAEEARQLMQEAPDFEITRKDARAVGLPVFRQAGRWGYAISGHPVE